MPKLALIPFFPVISAPFLSLSFSIETHCDVDDCRWEVIFGVFASLRCDSKYLFIHFETWFLTATLFMHPETYKSVRKMRANSLIYRNRRVFTSNGMHSSVDLKCKCVNCWMNCPLEPCRRKVVAVNLRENHKTSGIFDFILMHTADVIKRSRDICCFVWWSMLEFVINAGKLCKTWA